MVVSGTIAPPRDIPDLTAEETIRIILSNMNLVVPVICAIVVIIIAIVVICILRSKGNHHKGTLFNHLTNCCIFFLLFFLFFLVYIIITLRWFDYVTLPFICRLICLHYSDTITNVGNNEKPTSVRTIKNLTQSQHIQLCGHVVLPMIPRYSMIMKYAWKSYTGATI